MTLNEVIKAAYVYGRLLRITCTEYTTGHKKGGVPEEWAITLVPENAPTKTVAGVGSTPAKAFSDLGERAIPLLKQNNIPVMTGGGSEFVV